MSKIGTLLSVILTILNWISLTLIIYLTTMKSTVENNLTKVIIVACCSYVFDLLLLVAFCLTENECCESCFPADKCCLCLQDKKYDSNAKKSTNKDGKKEGNCCQSFCNVFYDCCILPCSGCTRKIGKHGVRYCCLLILSIAHSGMIALCIYSIKKTTNNDMGENTLAIIIVCGFVTIANLFGIIAPCFDCCEKLRYKSPPKKKKKSVEFKKYEKKDSKNDTKDDNKNNYDRDNIIVVEDPIKAKLLEKENNNNENNENNNMDEVANGDKNDNYQNVFGVKKEGGSD